MNINIYKFFRAYPLIKSYFYRLWNILKFRVLGIKFGRNLIVNDKIYVLGKGNIEIGDDFNFKSGSGINPICRNIRGVMCAQSKDSQIIIGDRVGISSSCLWAEKLIKIGNDVNIGGDCIIIDHDAHPHSYLARRRDNNIVDKDFSYNKIPVSPIIIEDDVWIGARCQILKGVNIGARSIVAAGSIVTRNIPADVIAGGNPCKVIRSLEKNEC